MVRFWRKLMRVSPQLLWNSETLNFPQWDIQQHQFFFGSVWAKIIFRYRLKLWWCLLWIAEQLLQIETLPPSGKSARGKLEFRHSQFDIVPGAFPSVTSTRRWIASLISTYKNRDHRKDSICFPSKMWYSPPSVVFRRQRVTSSRSR